MSYSAAPLHQSPLALNACTDQLIRLAKSMIPLALALNQPELRLTEVLVPWILVIGMLGFLSAWAVVAIMEHTGLSRRVWHLPLFFVALVVLFTSVIGLLFQP